MRHRPGSGGPEEDSLLLMHVVVVTEIIKSVPCLIGVQLSDPPLLTNHATPVNGIYGWHFYMSITIGGKQ